MTIPVPTVSQILLATPVVCQILPQTRWSASTVRGFAYTLEEVNATGAVPGFEYDTSGGNCDGSGDCFEIIPGCWDSQAPSESLYL